MYVLQYRLYKTCMLLYPNMVYIFVNFAICTDHLAIDNMYWASFNVLIKRMGRVLSFDASVYL